MRRPLRRPDVLHHRRLPPLLLPPQLPDGPGHAVPRGRRWPPPPPRRGRCGGPATTGSTTATPTWTATCTRPVTGSGGATWDGSCPPATRRPTRTPSRTSPPIRRSGSSTGSTGSDPGCSGPPASPSVVGAPCSSASCCPRSFSGTAPSWSIRCPTSWAVAATPHPTPAATR